MVEAYVSHQAAIKHAIFLYSLAIQIWFSVNPIFSHKFGHELKSKTTAAAPTVSKTSIHCTTSSILDCFHGIPNTTLQLIF